MQDDIPVGLAVQASEFFANMLQECKSVVSHPDKRKLPVPLTAFLDLEFVDFCSDCKSNSLHLMR
jgi:hypothetical protein